MYVVMVPSIDRHKGTTAKLYCQISVLVLVQEIARFICVFSAYNLMVVSYVKMSQEYKYLCLSCGNWYNVDQNCIFPW